MSDAPLRRTRGTSFSLRQLLTITALIAVGIAVGLAYRLNRSLTQQRDELLSLSSRLPIHSDAELVSVDLPALADDFHSWDVHVPVAQDLELRLGIGAISERGIPPIVGSVPLPSGKHRVTLYTGDSKSEAFRYRVYLDGEPVIEKTMGSQWLASGWSSASSVSWPTSKIRSPPPLQLSANSYTNNEDYGNQYYFNGQADSHVTRSGYRLWIDPPNRTYQPVSPFIGFPEVDPQFLGIGIRDGIRFGISAAPGPWNFMRPSLATTGPVLRVEAEFVTTEGTVLSRQSQAIDSWQISNSASAIESLRWQEVPELATHTAFLHATSQAGNVPLPIVELKWDVGRPDAVGMRLADTSANSQISRWRLRILDGSQHLWRELRVGDRPWLSPADALGPGNLPNESLATSLVRTAVLELVNLTAADIDLQWQTNEALPLQIMARKDVRFAGLPLYQGLPARMAIQIPATCKPQLSVDVVDANPTVLNAPLPGGSAFEAIQIELDATIHEWIWLSARPKE